MFPFKKSRFGFFTPLKRHILNFSCFLEKQDFETKIFTTCQVLKRKKYNTSYFELKKKNASDFELKTNDASDFDMKFFRHVRYLKKLHSKCHVLVLFTL